MAIDPKEFKDRTKDADKQREEFSKRNNLYPSVEETSNKIANIGVSTSDNEFLNRVPNEQETYNMYRKWLNERVTDPVLVESILGAHERVIKQRIVAEVKIHEESTGKYLGKIEITGVTPYKMEMEVTDIRKELNEGFEPSDTLRKRINVLEDKYKGRTKNWITHITNEQYQGRIQTVTRFSFA